MRLSKDKSVHVTDEVFNASSHLLGAVMALLGWVLLVSLSWEQHKTWHVISFGIYGFTLFVLFLFSTLHHGVNASERVEGILRMFDYVAVFLLIAGTVTPICLVLLGRAVYAWSVLGVIWLLAIVGIILTLFIPNRPRWVTNTLYIGMGWLGGPLLWPLHKLVSVQGLMLFVAGGVFYTIGWTVYHLEKPNPVPGRFGFHEIWHVLVLLGAFSHFLFMYRVVLPFPE